MRSMLVYFIVVSLYGGTSVFSPDLLEKLNNIDDSSTIEVLIHPVEQPDYTNLSYRFGYDYKAIVNHLRTVADRTQENILSYIENKPSGVIEYKNFWVADVIYLKAEKSVVMEISRHPDVGYIEEAPWRYIIRDTHKEGVLLSGNPPSIRGVEWNISKIKADSVWLLGYTGSGVIVGQLDTGVDVDHPAFGGRWTGYWFDAVNDSSYPYDDNNHGTHTMGTLLGGDGLGSDPDDIGVAPGAQFVVVKAFNSQGVGSSNWILAGFQWIAELVADSGVPVRTVSNSWGGSRYSLSEWDAVLTWRSLGIIPVFAIGNSGPSSGSAESPGNYPTVIGVGATNSSDNIAYFSSRGPAPDMSPWNDPSYWCNGDWDHIKPDISAPGVSIRSSVPGGGYQGSGWSGTSMATPHIAGVVALLLEKNPNIDFCTAYNLVINSADEPGGGSFPNNNYGWGRVNALRAINSMDQPLLSMIDREINSGGDSLLDQGETAELVVFITNFSDSIASNAQITLRSTSSYITLVDTTVVLGDIGNGDTLSNNLNPFIFDISSGTPDGEMIYFTVHLTANGGGITRDFIFGEYVGEVRYDNAQVIAGNAILTVTDIGGIGFELPEYGGTGFIYPIDGINLLYFGSLAIGIGSGNTVIDNWFTSSGSGDQDFNVVNSPWGKVTFIEPPPVGDVTVWSAFDDSAHESGGYGLSLRQVAYAYLDSLSGDFIVLQYKLVNEGSSLLDSIYIGTFMDFDFENYDATSGRVDSARNLSYMWEDTSHPYAGVVLLYPDSIANLSVLNNPTYVYPGNMPSEAVKAQFLRGELNFPESSSPDDWTAVVSTGPFSMNPSDTLYVIFGVVGGSDSVELMANVDTMRSLIQGPVVVEDPPEVLVEEDKHPSTLPVFVVNHPRPTPFYRENTLELSLKEDIDNLRVDIYNSAGQRVKELFRGKLSAGIHYFRWDGRDTSGRVLPSGIYFFNIGTRTDNIVRKTVLIR